MAVLELQDKAMTAELLAVKERADIQSAVAAEQEQSAVTHPINLMVALVARVKLMQFQVEQPQAQVNYQAVLIILQAAAAVLLITTQAEQRASGVVESVVAARTLQQPELQTQAVAAEQMELQDIQLLERQKQVDQELLL
jgi:hypothetical protein